MINWIMLSIPALLLFLPLAAQPSTLALKEDIQQLALKIQQADPKSQSELLLQLSKKYFLDQNQEKAFASFLEAIETADAKDQPADGEDSRLYVEALKVYLDPHAQSTRETASAILDKYSGIVKEHPNYTQLAFLVGASNANGGQYADFFDLFYRSYKVAPHHYLAYKTKAIIHIKLFERASTAEAKDIQRQKILDELSNAMDVYPQDHTLYKMMVAFAPQNQKEKVVSINLKKIVDSNMIIPRTDIGFYVEEAVKVRQYDSAQQLLDKAREWYQFSRIINTAQEFLDQHRKRG